MQAAARGQHQHRRPVLAPAHLPEHRGAVAVGQAQVQDHRGIARVLQGAGRVLGRLGLVDGEPLGFEALAKQLGELLVVLDDQQPHARNLMDRVLRSQSPRAARDRDSRL